MNAFADRLARSLRPPALAALLVVLVLVPRAHAARFLVAGATDTVAVAPGQTFTVDLVVRTTSPPFNAFDLDVRFDAARLTNVPMSPLNLQRGALMTSACITNSPFHLFTPSPDSLVCTLVILCNGVSVTGPGTVYRVQFKAGASDAWTMLEFGHGTAFYMGGPRVDTLETRPVVIKIGSPPPVLDAGDPGLPTGAALEAPVPNPGRRAATLSAVFQLPRAEDASLDLVDALGRRVAGQPRASFGPGRHRSLLALPRLAPGRYTLVLRTGAGEMRTRPWIVLR